MGLSMKYELKNLATGKVAELNALSDSILGNPWIQLALGVVCMAAVANMQYGWTLFVAPIDAKHHWGRSAIQIAFTIFVLIETWLVPVEGYLVDRFGPRLVVLGGAILIALAWVLATAPRANQSARSFTPLQVLRKPVFWVLYLMFVLVASGGLMMAASIGPIAKDLKVESLPVDLLGLVMPVGIFAITLDRVFDGVGRPFFGWVSDQIGRENTMAIAFAIGAVALLTFGQAGSNPVVFVVGSALYFGVFGEIYSLFPATQGDTFGGKYAAANAGMLYTAKGIGALLVPLAAGTAASMGWHVVFVIATTFNVLAAVLALMVFKPLRVRHFAAVRAELESQSTGRSPPGNGVEQQGRSSSFARRSTT
jgi:MFS family permease